MRTTSWLKHLAVCTLLSMVSVAPAQDQAARSRPAGEQPTPRLELSETEWSFGTAWYNTPLEHEVTLSNTGDAPLKITRVKTSCGCTASKLDQNMIMPGESVPMKVTYDSTKTRQNPNVVVTIESNDPRRPKTTFYVRGQIKPCFVVTPVGGIAFGRLVRESAETRTVRIKNVYEERMFLKLKELADATYDLKLKEIEPGMHYELTARTKPPLRPGNSRVEAVLTTNVERVPEIRIPIRSFIIPRVTVRPNLIYVPEIYRKPSERLLKVQSLIGNPVKVLAVTSAHAGVSGEVLPTITTNRMGYAIQEVRVRFPPGAELPDEGTTLKILTNAEEPEFAEITIRITKGRRRPAANTAGGRRAPAQAGLPIRPGKLTGPADKPKPAKPKKEGPGKP